ncbi:hypothetical protein G3I01_16175 [Gramella sp. MT6]|uniref:hypothetical protein n=1 Tax=Gramella sp. MT6 TaxID=2705471 RepID=UPI001C5DD209|nr:hypothetical protein [Gramella sp. MT6]QYA26966.1 hypothetical protein G3I01_16175 [Gramella sp. MT6]
MKSEVIYSDDLHFEHRHWQGELAFWQDELKSFKNRLEELSNRWTDENVLAQLEHFQNQFIRHGEVIDTLEHEINVHETDLANHSKKDEEVMDRELTKGHFEFRQRMEMQRKIYAELKEEFFRFLSKYM